MPPPKDLKQLNKQTLCDVYREPKNVPKYASQPIFLCHTIPTLETSCYNEKKNILQSAVNCTKRPVAPGQDTKQKMFP